MTQQVHGRRDKHIKRVLFIEDLNLENKIRALIEFNYIRIQLI